MKTLIIFLLVSTQLSARSVLPDLIVTPPLDLFNKNNKVLDNGDIKVKTGNFTKRGDFKPQGSSTILSKDDYDDFVKLASPVFEMIPKASNRDSSNRLGTAFSIGENLVLTNHHVLDPQFQNTSSCADFRIKNKEGDFFSCKEVHFCSKVQDICLIEMSPKKKKKKEISLKDGPKLKLRADYFSTESATFDITSTAIGNSAGFGIHLSQGKGVSLSRGRLYFYAPITTGNSGGPLLNPEGEVIGVVKLQSEKQIGTDPTQVYNVAAPIDTVILLIRHALYDKPEVLEKFNQAVIE